MIKTIHDYGIHLRDAPETMHHFSIFSPPYSQRTVNGKVFYAKIENKSFLELVEEPYNDSSEYLEKYIFRELASSNSAPVVPSCHFFYIEKADKWAESIEKFINKLERCFKDNHALFSKYFNINELSDLLRKALADKKLPESRNYFFTFKIDGKYLGEIPEIKALLETGAYDKYFKSKGDFYKAADKFCAVTYQDTPEVWGRVDTLGFTVNDIAFSRNGFNAKDSYKMFPVAPDAVKILEGTMNILEREMSFGFYNLRFFVLPRFVAISNRETRKKLALGFYRKTKMNAQEARENSRTFTNLNRAIFNAETLFDEILEDDQFNRQDLYYDIFFYEQKQAQFSIKLHISEVLPSRFGKILKAKQDVEKKYYLITRKTTKDGNEYVYYIRFATIKDYFSTKVRTDTVYEPIFFKIIEAVFYKNELEEAQIVKAFMAKIVLAFKQQNDFEFRDTVKHSFCIHQFFQTLKLFKNSENMKENKDNSVNVCLNAPDFVAQHPLFFPDADPLKKAAFYLGCATETVLNAQRRHLNSAPFYKKLNNLQLDYALMQDLVSKLSDKANEYSAIQDKYGKVLHYQNFKLLMKDFAVNVTRASEVEFSKNMISFAFTLGLIMEKEFRAERYRLKSSEEEVEGETQS